MECSADAIKEDFLEKVVSEQSLEDGVQLAWAGRNWEEGSPGQSCRRSFLLSLITPRPF